MGNSCACIRQCGGESSGVGTSIEEQIEQSKSHWSLLADQSDCIEEGQEAVAEVDNVEVFKALQMHPTWGHFFATFGYELIRCSAGSLVVGEKFAEGGQAELFHAHVMWRNRKGNEWDRERGREWVVKVFKKGTFLRHLQKQLPHGYLQFCGQEVERWKSPLVQPSPRYYCHVIHGILLEDGRFAFLMLKEQIDLRTVIDHNMKLKRGKVCQPFSKEEGEIIMYSIALGVDWLHEHDIVHRDLKASNVLLRFLGEVTSGWPKWQFLVADYECSVGVVGTGFFRAPEILQACKEHKLSERLEVFSRAADVYGYGMICYEILTGKLPFDGHYQNDYDFVINGQRLVVPKYIEDWTRALLSRCWDSNPSSRPTMGEVMNILSANSRAVRKYENLLKEEFGENFEIRHHIITLESSESSVENANVAL